MKVFVAGASGAIGRPLVAALVAAKHEVIGMTSGDAGIKVLREKGVEGVVVNALDADAVRAETARMSRPTKFGTVFELDLFRARRSER